MVLVMNLSTVTEMLIEKELIHETGGGRCKLSRTAARLVSALAFSLAAEWSATVNQIKRQGGTKSARDHAQAKYAENLVSGFKLLATRSVQKWRIDDIIRGNYLAEDHHAETDFSLDPTVSPVIRTKKR